MRRLDTVPVMLSSPAELRSLALGPITERGYLQEIGIPAQECHKDTKDVRDWYVDPPHRYAGCRLGGLSTRMIAAGVGREAAAGYLDSQYKRTLPPPADEVPQRGAGRVQIGHEALVRKYAGLHRLEPAVIRAVMQAESALNPAAVSVAGAIGLMQLMPATARELGVNPYVPEQNVEGGVRYLPQLLAQFGRLEIALVAYNAGPGFARRYVRGQAALYGETRAYVKSVLARVPLGR